MPQLSDTIVREEGAILTYPVAGDFTAQTAISFKEKILRLEDHSFNRIILDMTAVTDADIVGVNVLVQLFLFVMRKEGVMEVRLVRGGPLDNILRLTRFHHHFNLVFPS